MSPGAGTRSPRSALLVRVLTAAVGLPLILLAVVAGDPWFTAAVAAALAVAALEFCHGAGLGLRTPEAWLAAAACASLAAAPHIGLDARDAAVVAFVVAVLTVAVVRADPPSGAPHWLTTAGAVLYVGWLGHYFVLLHDLPDGRDWVLLALLATFASDTGAYFTGVTIGRHRMAPAISPKKTWEGFAGGVLACIGATVALYALAAFPFDAGRAVGLGLVFAVLAPLGDLAESLLKRGMGVKDASGLVPGHGGFLDRLDSLLFVTPTVYFFVLWLT